MVEFKSKLGNTYKSGIMEPLHGVSITGRPIYRLQPVLVDAVQVFIKALNIQKETSVLLKKKRNMWDLQCGNTFLNNTVNKISCHVYIHRHSTVLGTLIFLAHEMVHAWQIDTDQPNKKGWEDQAEMLSINMVQEFQLNCFPDKPISLCIGEVKMARGWAH